MTPMILFLCPHGAAKSLMAAMYFKQLSAKAALDWQVTFAGTEPDEEWMPTVVELLASEGIDVPPQAPRHVMSDDLKHANRIISLGCDVNHLVSPNLSIEYWNEVPPPSQQLQTARDLIYTHVEQLVHDLSKASTGL